MITKKEIKNLNEIKAKTPIVSLYLNTDQQFLTPEQIIINQKDLLKRVKDLISEKNYDLIRNEIKFELDKETKGIVFYVNPEERIWRIYRFRRPFQNEVHVEKNLHLKPLINMMDEYERYCTVVVDKEKARIFLVYMGEIEENSYIFDEFPGEHKQGGWSQRRFQNHLDEHYKQHLKKVADKTLDFFKKYGFDRLIISGSKEILSEFEGVLNSYLKERVVGKFHTEMFKPMEHFLKQSLVVEEKIEREKEDEMISDLDNKLGAKNKAVNGLDDVLNAAQEGKIMRLFVNEGYKEKGWRCKSCNNLLPDMEYEKCTYCEGNLEKENDIVDELVQKAIAQGAKVEFVKDNKTLEKLGNVGALLRF